MTPKHHPDPSTIVAYAAGSVTEGFSLVVAAHLEYCKQCQLEVSEVEQLGGSLLEQLPPVDMKDQNLKQLWASIDGPTYPEQAHCSVTAENGLPAVLSPFLSDDLEKVEWRTLVPGIQQKRLADVGSEKGSVRLLRIAQGVKIPNHAHLGTELTLILQGSYSDGLGRFEPGDLSDLDSSVQHQPFVDSDQPCVCLIATDQPLRFNSVLHRVIQPLIGI